MIPAISGSFIASVLNGKAGVQSSAFTPVSFKCCSLDRAWEFRRSLVSGNGISVLNKLQSLFSAHLFLLVQFLILVLG